MEIYLVKERVLQLQFSRRGNGNFHNDLLAKLTLSVDLVQLFGSFIEYFLCREKLDTAVKAIMKDGMRINRARDRFQVSYEELDEALLKNGGHKIVHHAKDHRFLSL